MGKSCMLLVVDTDSSFKTLACMLMQRETVKAEPGGST